VRVGDEEFVDEVLVLHLGRRPAPAAAALRLINVQRLGFRVTTVRQRDNDFGLRDQMRRAAVSVMSNIAEGYESCSHSQFVRYLNHAKASAREVRSQLYIACDLDYFFDNEFQVLFDLAVLISKQLSSLIQYLKSANQRYCLIIWFIS
jgi:four helix bundle protein